MASAPLAQPPEAFRRLSARLGADPLQIQGPGGNTSFKSGGAMWIKASGTRLADAGHEEVFVAVDLERARAEIDGRAGDGTCRAARLDPDSPVRPSIETTFHALLDWPVVLHTHSVATLAHVVGGEGTRAALARLEGLGAVAVPYRKPGLPLTHAIREAAAGDPPVLLLRNHGLIVCGRTVEEADGLIREVEARLALTPSDVPGHEAGASRRAAPLGWREVPWATALAAEPMRARATAGTLYPDHAVFLGPGVGTDPDEAGGRRVVVTDRTLLREDAPPVAEAMLRCLLDVLSRVPPDWTVEPIGTEAEAALLDWDAETYRQKLAQPGEARPAAPEKG